MSARRLRYCPIVGCQNFRGSADNDLRFFYVSRTDKEPLIIKWIESIRTYMPDFPETVSRLRICQLHFDPNDMIQSRSQIQLIPGAIPKRFPFEVTKIKQEIVPGVPPSLQKIILKRIPNKSIKVPQSVQNPLNHLRKSRNGAALTCTKCLDYTAQIKVMQAKMHELQSKINEQQCEITALHKRNEYLKEFEPDAVQTTDECSVCASKLTTDEFFSHLCQQSSDINSVIIQCEYCIKSYSSTINLLNHLRVTHNNKLEKKIYHCKQCPKEFEMTQLMDIHEQTHPDEKPPEILCEKCSQKFFTQHDYDEHTRTQHLTLKPFQCGLGDCNEKFCSASLLREHMSKNHGPARSENVVKASLKSAEKSSGKITFECYLCGKKNFRSFRTVKIHLKKHRIPSIGKCLVCWTKMYTSELKVHLCENVAKTNDDDISSINCEYCSKKFKSIIKLFRHVDNKHATIKTLYRCIKCTSTYPIKSLVECHQVAHMQETFKCNKCSKMRSFETLDALNRHIERHESKEEVHLCDVCGSALKSKRNLRIHKLSHAEPQLSCNQCPKKFHNLTHLRKHQNFHSNQTFSCHLCNFKCSSSGRLCIHIKRHTQQKEKRFECSMCSYKCTERCRLNNHLSTVHTTIRQFQCVYCPNRSYKHKGDLNKHLRTHLGDDMYACPDCPKRFRLQIDLQKHASEHYVEKKIMANTDT